jgi:hypothetical protein
VMILGTKPVMYMKSKALRGATTIKIMANHPSTGMKHIIPVPTSGRASDHLIVLMTSGWNIFFNMLTPYRKCPNVSFPPTTVAPLTIEPVHAA